MTGEQAREAVPQFATWRTALLPAVTLLGFALPVGFLSLIDQYLYYLRPLELVQTYATAWLLLALPALPVCGLLALGLSRLRPAVREHGARDVLVWLLYGIALAITLSAFSDAVLMWLRTFALLSGVVSREIVVAMASSSITAGIIGAMVPALRVALVRAYPVMQQCAIVGGLLLITLPFGALGTVGRGSLAVVAANSQGRPNVLLVTVDTLSAEHMSLYGAKRATTPELEEFARGATVFDRAYANANFTTPGIASILTATRPWSHRALQLPAWPVEDTRRSSLPALMSLAGYQTGYVTSNPWASPGRQRLGQYFGFAAGNRMPRFSSCLDALSAVLRMECAASELRLIGVGVRIIEGLREMVFDAGANQHFDPRGAMEPALHWLAHADKRVPIFLWIHFYPPHEPYAAPTPWLGTFDSSPDARSAVNSTPEQLFLYGGMAPERRSVLQARYDESVKYIDHYLGEFLRRAHELLGDNTVVIVTADHGESLEHGYGGHTGPGLFDEIVHIPLVMKLPSQTRGMRTSVLAEQVDIAPTIAQLVGMPAPQSWEGRSLLGAAADPDDPPALKPVFTMNFEENPRYGALRTGSIAVIEGRWKLVHYMGALHYAKMPELHDALYDLAADPREQTNQITDEPGQAKHLLTLITTELARHGGPVR